METLSNFNFLRPDPSRTELFQYTYDTLESSQNKQININIEEKSKLVDENKMHQEISKDLSEFKDKIKLFISITINNDDPAESEKLGKSLEAIEVCSRDLESKLGIKTEQILIFAFMKNINQISNIQWLFPGLPNDQLSNEGKSSKNVFYCNILYKDFKYTSDSNIKQGYFKVLFALQKDINTYTAQKALLLGFCKDLHIHADNDFKNNSQGYFALFLENGVCPESIAITNMILALSYENSLNVDGFNLNINKNYSVIGSIIPINNDNNGFCSKIYPTIQQYEYLHNSIYDHYIKDLSSINSFHNKFFMLKIIRENWQTINNYFVNNNFEDAYCHSDKLNHYIINQTNLASAYLPDARANIDNTNTDFPELMKDNTDRQSTNMLMFFTMLYSTFSCRGFTCRKILFTFVNIINMFGLFVNFVLPGLIIFVIHSIFTEAFGTKNNASTYFFTIIYMLFIVLTAIYSLIAKNPRDLSTFFLILSYFFLIFYIFVLICSCVAINNIRIGKNQIDGDLYKFDAGKFSAIIVVNIIVALIPIILNCKNYLGNLAKALIYLTMGTHNNTSVFLIYSLFNMIPAFNKNNYRKALFLTIFFILNVFFGFLIFVIDTRSKRAESVFILSLIFTIYNIIKIFLIVLSFLRNKMIRVRDMNRFNAEKLKKYFSGNIPLGPVNAEVNNTENNKAEYASASALIRQEENIKVTEINNATVNEAIKKMNNDKITNLKDNENFIKPADTIHDAQEILVDIP